MSLKLGNTDIAGTQLLYSTTGSNTDGAMTQAATTTQLSLKANDADVVHLTGNETIAGEKGFTTSPWVFNASPGLLVKNTVMDRTVSSVTSNQYANLDFRDKNNQTAGNMYLAYYTSGTRSIKMALQNDAGNSSDIALLWNSTDGFYTYAPASGINNSIVTTVNKSKTANGYFQLGNGLIINWGQVESFTANANVVTTKSITFSKAYTVAPKVMTTIINNSTNVKYGSSIAGIENSITTTGCTLCYANNNSSGSQTPQVLWIAIGF
jgi:hypothetical protein